MARIVQAGPGVGQSVSTLELESPERAQDHFDVAPTTPNMVVGTAEQNGAYAALLAVETKGGDGTHILETASDAGFTADLVAWSGSAALTNERATHVAFVRPLHYFRLRRSGGTTDPTVNGKKLQAVRA